MKASDLNQALHDHISEEELTNCFSIRGYKLTPKGEQLSKTIKQSLTAILKRIFNQPKLVDFFNAKTLTNHYNY